MTDLAAIVAEMRSLSRLGYGNAAIANKISELADRLEALHSQAQEREGCVWTRTDDAYEGETWNSHCGAKYCFTEEGPAENGHKFCHCCGKTLVIAAAPTGGSET